MYTGSMFKEDCKELFNKGKLTQDEVLKLVKSNYYVCLVTKKENEMLPKSKRGNGIAGALEAYKNAGIEVNFPDTRADGE
jgi:ribosomal protein L13